MDDLNKHMLKSGICPHCFRTLQETSGDQRWVVVKENNEGIFIHFLLCEVAPSILDPEVYGTITCQDTIPPDLGNDNFYWICRDCYVSLKEEINRKSNPDQSQDERWMNDLDEWR